MMIINHATINFNDDAFNKQTGMGGNNNLINE